ncbi:MAG: DUF432 domain-containing protein [Candidatus Methanofastidiosia archaeon]
MFGSYQFGKPVNLGSITLETYEDAGLYVYHRKSDSELKKIMSSPFNLLVNPVEPVTQPEKVTHYLLIRMAFPVLVASESKTTLFLTFPIEIGVFPEVEDFMDLGFFTSTRKEEAPIDLFTLTNPKYTLYGDPDNGVICKMWESDIHTQIPQVNPLSEGVVKVEIQNSAPKRKEMIKLVFDALHMKIFYKEFAMVNAVVKINKNDIAETSFLDEPPLEGMKKAARIFSSSKVPAMEKESFFMEWGL